MPSVIYADPSDEKRSLISAAFGSTESALTVDTVADAADLRTRLTDHATEYACVVTEYQFETTDAISLFEGLHTDDRVPFVLYTDAGDERLASDAFAAGLDGYVPKDHPEAIDRLLTQVRATVEDEIGLSDPVEEIHEVALGLASCSNVDAVFDHAVAATNQVLASDATALFVEPKSPAISRISDDLHPIAVTGTDDAVDRIRDTVCEGLAEQVDRTGEAATIDPSSYTSLRADATETSAIRSVLSVPIEGVGVLQSISRTPGAFDSSAVNLATLVATTVASTVMRIRSERELRDERDRFAALFESVPDAVLLLNRADGIRIVAVNPSFEDLFGYDRETLDERGIDELLVPDGNEELDVYESVGLETVVTAEVERRTVDGPSDFLFRGFATEIDGEIHEYAIYTDTAEQKRRERKLERYRTLVETVSDSMYVLDSAGRVEIINGAMADCLGDPREAIVDEHVTEFISADELEERWDLLEEIHASEDRASGTVEKTLESADGTTSHIEDHIAPVLDDDGRLTGSVGVIRDITARKEHENRIQSLHDGTRRLMAATGSDEIARVVTGIASNALDLDLNSVFLYEDVTARSTRSAPDATSGRADDGSVPDSGAEATDGLVSAALSDRAVDLFGDVEVIEPGGGIAWDAYEAGEAIVHDDVRRAPNVRNPETPIRSEAHIPLGEHGIFIVSSLEANEFDPEALTLARILAANAEAALDRAERECKLADRSRELERQNDRLEAFASTVSHDLRNPLTLATGHLENVERYVDEDGEHHREEIEWALDRMDELVENVLTLARSGERLTETASVDLDAVLDRAHRTVDPSLEVVRDDPLPTVDGDETRLRALFENALRNAREHVGDDVTVTVTATPNGFAIEDDGPGIPADERDAVLEWGYSTETDGTGFGLAIVSEVVEAHGWSLALRESATGGLRLAVSIDGERYRSG